MPDDHRRVEARAAIPGTGMLTDPERIEEVQRRAARFERDTAPRAKKKFGEVLTKSKQQREEEEKEETEEELRAREEEAAKIAAERKSVRELMGRGAVHPGHGGRRGRVAIKG
jgi:vacuolar-type H+-ATPase subunit I/STV1